MLLINTCIILPVLQRIGLLICKCLLSWIYTLPAKNMEYFAFQRLFAFFVECAGCFCTWNTFLLADITFWGVNLHLTTKWRAKVQKQLCLCISQLDHGYNSCFPLVRLLPYLFVCCIEILFTIPLFIYRLFWCSQQGISVVGASHRRTWGVVLVYHKVGYTNS